MKRIKLVLLAVAVLAAVAALVWWWNDQRLHPSTEDAYVQAGILTVAAQVGGQVSEVSVAEHQRVAAGDVLVRLDTASLRAAVDAAQAQLDIATQGAGAAGSNAAAAASNLDAANAALASAEADLTRAQALFSRGDVASTVRDNARTARDQAAARRDAAAAALAAAQAQLGAEGDDNASVRAARAAVQTATIQLDHATVTAPADGWIANLSLRPGQVIGAGSPLFSLVEDGAWWIDANFKETDLERIKPGQTVTVTLDMYPGVKLTGRVDSLGAGSQASFSLLPAQNASGNWVKVTQRFPVRIALDPPQGVALRVGASASVRVDTTR